MIKKAKLVKICKYRHGKQYHSGYYLSVGNWWQDLFLSNDFDTSSRVFSYTYSASYLECAWFKTAREAEDKWDAYCAVSSHPTKEVKFELIKELTNTNVHK